MRAWQAILDIYPSDRKAQSNSANSRKSLPAAARDRHLRTRDAPASEGEGVATGRPEVRWIKWFRTFQCFY